MLIAVAVLSFVGKRGILVAALIVELLVELTGWTLCFGLHTLK